MVDFQSRESRRGHDNEDEESEQAKQAETEPDSSEMDPGELVAEGSSNGEVTDEGLGVAVVRVNGEFTVEDDRAGAAAIEVLEQEDYEVPTREVVAADYDNVQQTIGGLVVRDDVDAIVTLGGVGVGPDEVTVEAVRALVEKILPGFGELFRTIARESNVTGIVRNRTTAGLVDGVPVFCLPETEDAARIGLADIALPELEALVAEAGE
ncbi:MAG: molybdopterin-binding protein [Haloarculaceae archaeon]